MNFIGPRPIVKEEISKYDDSFNLYKRVKPGLTGLWQVSGRNNISYDMRIQLDASYIKDQSLIMDCKILLKTILVKVYLLIRLLISDLKIQQSI